MSVRDTLRRFGLQALEVADVCADVRFHDPFRQLEDETREVLAWQRHMNAVALDDLRSRSGMEALTEELGRYLAADDVLCPVAGGDVWFSTVHDETGSARRLCVSASPDGHQREVICADAVGVDGDETIDWYIPSPDGRLVAIGVSSHGDEQSVMAIVDVGSSEVLPPSVRHVSGGSVAWLPDSSGLYLCRGSAPDPERSLKGLAFLKPGEAPSWVDVPALATDFRLTVHVSRDGRFLALATGVHAPRVLAIQARATGVWSEAFPVDDGHLFHGVFLGDEYYAVTTEGAERGRVVATPVERVGDRSYWREIVAEGEAVVRCIVLAGDELLIHQMYGDLPQLRLVSREGKPGPIVPLPRSLVIGSSSRQRNQATAVMPAQVARNEIVFTASALGRSTTLWRYERSRERLTEITRPSANLPELHVQTLTCRSRDGERVTVDLVRRADRRTDEPQPILLHGYGGFNAASLPKGYLSGFTPWVAAGGTCAFAHLRGDGTFGSTQWHRGRRAYKQRTFDDLLAVTDLLLARGLTTRGQLALYGASNGGLLVSAAITQRPEWFRAAAILIPLCDMGRFHRERFAEGFRSEYGDPRLPEEAQWLRAYSPYHLVEPGTPYPATLIIAGDRDMRTHAWHARKMAAALLDASTGTAPIFLRVHENQGHETTGRSPSGAAEWLGFLMAEVGLPLSARDGAWDPVIDVDI